MNIFSTAKLYKQKLNKFSQKKDKLYNDWVKFNNEEKKNLKHNKIKMREEYVGPEKELQEYIDRIEKEINNPIFRSCRCREPIVTMEHPNICRGCGGIVTPDEEIFEEPNLDNYESF